MCFKTPPWNMHGRGYSEIVPQSPYMRRSVYAAFISAYAVITFAYAHVEMSAYTEVMFVYVDMSAYLCECYHCICRDKDCIYSYPLHICRHTCLHMQTLSLHMQTCLYMCASICIMLADIKALHIILSTVGITDTLTCTL